MKEKQAAMDKLLAVEKLQKQLVKFPDELFESNILTPSDIKSAGDIAVKDIRKDLLKTDCLTTIANLEQEINVLYDCIEGYVNRLKKNESIFVGMFV